MGRKSSIDLKGLTSRIVKMANVENCSIKQIVEILNSEGIAISSSAIQRKIKSASETVGDFLKAIDESQILIDTVRQNPNTDVVEACMTLLARKIFENICQLENIDFASPSALAAALSKLTTAQTHVSKLRLTYQKGFEEAKKTILEALREEVKNYPEVVEKLTSIVSSMKAKEKYEPLRKSDQ